MWPSNPSSAMTAADREALLASAFQINHENLLNRYPRFRELWEKTQKSSQATAAKAFTPQDILDLQVLSQLAWFDEIFLAGDPEVVRLVKKERGYTENDKLIVRKKEIELFNVTLEEYRKAAERGQIEISTSPFYHPILPLLCDTNIASESHPGVKLPRRRFRHPEDARDQLRAAVALHENGLRPRPQGLVAERRKRFRRGPAPGRRGGLYLGGDGRRRSGADQANGILPAG
jgi:alpha-amylase/alpha-mannosidase (GH57 family)